MEFERLKCLLDRLLNEGVVPFLGAGISSGARHRNLPKFKPELNKDALKKDLLKHADDQSLIHRRDYFETLWKAIDTDSTDRLSDFFAWLRGQVALCETLEIHEFRDLNPTPAHAYLAFLAREGLIHEIFTTNYDTCVEQAFRETFTAENEGNEYLKVITSLEEYRRDGGLRWVERGFRRPVLCLIKLNGCAFEYARKRNTSEHELAARAILLTEQQLQTHDKSPWKRDLLRDRLRRLNLLFCGFGNDEPQVRYLTMQIHDEFGGDGRHVSDEMLSLPNTPFIAVYGYTLSFPQLQVLESFYRNHRKEFMQCFKENYSDVPVFCAEDVNRFEHLKDNLSADRFFKWVFQGAYHRLLQRYTRRNSLFYIWLRERTPHPDSWVHFLLESLYPATDSHKFGHWRFYLTLDEQSFPAPLPLMQLLLAIDQAAPRAGQRWYLPLREAPVLIPCFLLLLCLLNMHKRSDLGMLEKGGVFIVSRKLHIQIVSQRLLGQYGNEQTDQHRLRFRISIPDLGGAPIEERWRHERRGENLYALTVGRVRNIPLEWLITEMQSPDPERFHGAILRAMENRYEENATKKRLVYLESPA